MPKMMMHLIVCHEYMMFRWFGQHQIQEVGSKQVKKYHLGDFSLDIVNWICYIKAGPYSIGSKSNKSDLLVLWWTAEIKLSTTLNKKERIMKPPKKKETPKRMPTKAEREKATYIKRGTTYSHESGRDGASSYLIKDTGIKRTAKEKEVDKMMARVIRPFNGHDVTVRNGAKSSKTYSFPYQHSDGSQSYVKEDKPKKKKK
jgi:hypothetical protein